MRYYFKHLFSYDWLKYLAIILACILLWSSIFSIVNNYETEEKLTVFLCAQAVNPCDQLESMEASAEDNGILQLNLNCYDYESDKFPTVLAVKGIYGSDILILDEASTELYLSGGNALALTPELLADLLVDERDLQIKYLEDRPAALKIYDSSDSEYSSRFSLPFLELGEGKYYLIINGKSIHAEPYAEGHTDAAIDLCRIILSK